jgi:hypothetical protein
VRKALSPRRRWRREVRFCLYGGKSSMRSPRLRARGAGRCSLGALHAVCAAARVIHHPGVTRCGCSNSADVRIKSAAPLHCELCANASKLQWLAPTLPGLLRARHVDRSASAVVPRHRVARMRPVGAGEDGLVRIVPMRPPEADVARPGCPGRPGSPSAPQNSILIRKIPVPEQPPVREARVRSAAIALCAPHLLSLE